MAKNINLKLDMPAIGEGLKRQFQGLQGRHPGLWPIVPKSLLSIGLFAGLLALAYAFYWRDLLSDLEIKEQQEASLKKEYQDKLAQAINLESLRRQKEQVGQYVVQLEKQLPSKAEMDALLSDINQAGVGRGLQFELFRPGQVIVREYYAELPINVRVTGTYHDIGGFTSDLANLPRIVTLNNLAIQQIDRNNTTLSLEAVAKTFRYLDAEEINQQRREAAQQQQKKK